jgi:hypothetical protein
VRIARHGEPRLVSAMSLSLDLLEINLRRLIRVVTRDKRWDVGLNRGGSYEDGQQPELQSIEADREQAIEAAIRLAREIEHGAV